MSFSITVPVSLMNHLTNEADKALLLEQLRRLRADEIFFTLLNLDGEIDRDCAMIREAIPFFAKNHIRTGVWVGGSLAHFTYTRTFRNQVTLDGTEIARICPRDDEFTAYYCAQVKKIAETGIRRIAFDDDFRAGWGDCPPCCFCEAHMQRYREALGENLTREQLAKRIRAAGMNRSRALWLDETKAMLEDLAKAIRATVDAVDPTVNITLCSGPSHWGADGSSAIDLSRIFAGQNRQTLRLIGAPYWGKRLGAIDFARKQAQLCSLLGIETMAEGDVYPRPRYTTPAAYLECYEQIIRADGHFNGILKYGLDYTSSPRYEQGYAERAEADRPLTEEIGRIFGPKRACGVSVYEPFDAIRYADHLPDGLENRRIDSPAIRFLNDLTIPAVFVPGNVNIVFGENACNMPLTLLNNGTILDAEAAKVLRRRGVDVGIAQFPARKTDAEHTLIGTSAKEYYYAEQELVAIYGDVKFEAVELKPGVQTESEFRFFDQTVPAAFRYENADGQRFWILNCNAQESQNCPGVFRSYARQRQVISAIEWLQERPMTAVCTGHPDLYMMVKKDDASVSVGLWNYSADRIEMPTVTMDKPYARVEGIHCDCETDGRAVRVKQTLYPFEFCGFTVYQA